MLRFTRVQFSYKIVLLKSEKSIPEKSEWIESEISLLNTIADDAKKSLLEVCT